MKRKITLSKEQTQQLYEFTCQHYVEYFDVQTELVDHLANDIEQIWQEQPTLSFERTKDISFKKFGVFGFMDVVDSRAKALSKKYWELVWVIFKQFFTIPYIIISSTIFLALFFSLKLFSTKILFVSIGVFILFYRLYFLRKEKKQRFKKTNKKWLLEEYVFNIGGGVAFINFFFQMAIYSPENFTNTIMVIEAFILTSFILLIYIQYIFYLQKLKKFL